MLCGITLFFCGSLELEFKVGITLNNFVKTKDPVLHPKIVPGTIN